MISIHAPRVGSDRHVRRNTQKRVDFNPRSPGGERPWSGRSSPRWSYFNPRSPGGERLHRHARADIQQQISIHAPRVGSDDKPRHSTARDNRFQSTLPGWGATCGFSIKSVSCRLFQSTLPGWGATDFVRPQRHVSHISIHAPRMGSDTTNRSHAPSATPFQSTLPGWGAT